MVVLQALPTDWNTIHSIILNKSASFTLQGTIDALLEHETTLWQQHDSVLMVCHDHKSRSPTPPNVVHQAPNRLICSNCKIPGHSINTCHFEGGGAEGQTPKKKRLRPNINIQNRGQKENNANMARENHSPSPPSNVYMFHSYKDAFLSLDSSTSSSSLFIIDSGASAHMCHDQSFYSSYCKIDPPRSIYMANNSIIEAVGVSDINIHTTHNGQTKSSLIKGALHL